MSEPIKTGGPAFPRGSKWALDGSIVQQGGVGMSVRTHFAGLAMQGLLGNANLKLTLTPDEIASVSVQQADALIAALKL